MRLIGRVPRAHLDDGSLVRLHDPPFDVLVALVDGVPHAIEDACNHAGASLSEGERDGRCVICPMHAYAFDLVTGRLVRPHGLCGDQRRFIAQTDGEDVVVWDPGAHVSLVGLQPLVRR